MLKIENEALLKKISFVLIQNSLLQLVNFTGKDIIILNFQTGSASWAHIKPCKFLSQIFHLPYIGRETYY